MNKQGLIVGIVVIGGLVAWFLWPEGSQNDAPELPPTPIDPATVGEVTGTVRFEGEPPAPSFIDMSGKAECHAIHPEKLPDAKLLVKGGRVQNAVVYVKIGLESFHFKTPVESARMDQKGCLFEPRVAAVQVNQPVLFLNSDPTAHNVHSTARDGAVNGLFNVSLQTAGVKQTVKFSKSEIGIQMECNYHPWMLGYLCVFAHPFFQVTGEDGAFSLKGLPPGDYEVAAWHEVLGVRTQKVHLEPKGSRAVTLTFSAKN